MPSDLVEEFEGKVKNNPMLDNHDIEGMPPPFYPLAVSEDEEVQYRLLQGALPTGWDRQKDNARGRYFYINHVRKLTSWIFPLYEAEDRRASNYMAQARLTPTDTDCGIGLKLVKSGDGRVRVASINRDMFEVRILLGYCEGLGFKVGHV